MQRSNDEVWAAIARDWAEGVESVAAIAARHRMFPARIYVRAKQEGWPPRIAAPPPAKVRSKQKSHEKQKSDEQKPKPPRRQKAPPVSPEPHPADAPRDRLVRRLIKAIDLKLEQLEKRMSCRKAASAADSERQTRELAQITRAYENVLELSLGTDRTAGTAASPASAADAERWRGEIARRLERLGSGRNTSR
jgi:hypothetical protein